MHPLAIETNARLPEQVLRMLSDRGQAIFFPSKGILGQAAQARGRRINATIGIALEEDGTPMRLAGLDAAIPLSPRDAFPYAPSYGKAELRDCWAGLIRTKNPSLGDMPISRPVVTSALTHALSVAGYLFLDPGEQLILSDLYWGNYGLIFKNAFGAELTTYPTFENQGFNVDGLKAQLLAGEPGKRVVVLNFPNNPTGYTCTAAEARGIKDALVSAADAGSDVVVLIDDAYFGLVYDDAIMTESIFAQLGDAHERILAVKIDGATKEDYAWGFRVGFITYAGKGLSEDALLALADKTAGAVRGNISNASHLSQSLLLSAYKDQAYQDWKAEKYAVMKKRYDVVRTVLENHPEYQDSFEALPFNSGYFMCVRPRAGDVDQIRRHLLEHFDTGVIATSGLIRVAFSSAPTGVLPELFENLHQACQAVAQGT